MTKLAKTPAKILLIVNQQIGDVLLSTPLLHAMRQEWTTAFIDILVFTNTAPILEGNTDCDQVITISHRPTLSERWHLLNRIWRRYDIAVTTQGNDRAHFYAWLGAPLRFGLIPDLTKRSLWKRLSCKSWVLLDEAKHNTVTQNILLADCLNIGKNYHVVPPTHIGNLEELYARLDLSRTVAGYVVIHPMPLRRYKRWTESGWQELLDYLTSKNQQVIISGGPWPEEISYCEKLAASYSHAAVSIAGKVSFAELATILRKATAYVGPDTVTTHLAAACGTPTLALFGPTNPVKWGPWPLGYDSITSPWENVSPLQQVNNVMLLQGLGDCVPCHKAGCDDHNESESRCMNELPAQRVIQALETLLAETA